MAREKSGWGGALAGAHRPRHCGCRSSFGSFIATVAEAEVDSDGEVHLRRVVSAVDTGIVVNPDTVDRAVAGRPDLRPHRRAVWRDHHRERPGRSRAISTTIACCASTRCRTIEVHLIKSGEAPGGIGETGTTAAPPAAAQRDLCRHRRPAAAAADRPRCSGAGGNRHERVTRD